MKIYINGTGSISAAGTNPQAARDTYTAGLPTWTKDQKTSLPVYPVAELPDHPEVEAFIAKTQPDRTTQLALHAADQAVTAAGWQGKDFAILVGCSRGPTESWEQGFTTFTEYGEVRPRTSPQTTLGSIGFGLATYFGVTSLADSLSVTCSSGMHAILHGLALLRAGMVDRVLVGGTEAPLTPFTLQQLQALRVYATAPEADQHACRPLAAEPSGMVVGEGAAFLALSREPAADGSSRELKAIAFARENQPSMTGISAEGQALQTCMDQLVKGNGRPDLIIAHAPGTARGDAAERAAISTVFGDSLPPVTSYKWATGHTFGASGPLAIVAGLTEHQEKTMLVNATGFGGNVVSVLCG